MKKFSIIIPTYNHCDDLLKPCIESIQKYTTLNEEIEIIIVANGCTDNTKEYLETLDQNYFKIIFDKRKLGYPLAVNIGIRHSRGVYKILLNNDIILLEQEKDAWLKRLYQPFKENSNIGITGLADGDLGLPKPYNRFLIFFCVMISSTLIDKIGLLETWHSTLDGPSLGGCEDADYCFRAQKNGFEIKNVAARIGDDIENKLVITDFPIYHKAEGTMHDDEHYDVWQKVFPNNIQKLKTKYRIFDQYLEKIKIKFPKLYSNMILGNEYAVDDSEFANKTVIDVGANEGAFTAFALARGAQRVISVEPSPKTYNRLVELFNYERGLTILQNAISDKNDEIIYMTDDSDNSHVITEPNENQATTITLNTILEKYCKDDNDIILKLDCEGGEYPALKNLSHQEIRRFEVIHIEIHQFDWMPKENTIQDLSRFIKQHGFKQADIKKNYWWEPDKNGNWIPVREIPATVFKFVRTKETHVDVTVEITTKNRYDTTLPLAIQSIISQTIKPKKLIIFDDGEHRDLRNSSLYKNLFYMLDYYEIDWCFLYGERKGHVLNHQKSLELAKTEFVWRIDDDHFVSSDVLEKLHETIQDKNVGAVAGLVIHPDNIMDFSREGKFVNKMSEITSKPNAQWGFHDGSIKEAEHLYSSFLYRKEAAKHGYCMELTKFAFREETIFTYEMKHNGWKLLIDTSAVIWHYRADSGGARDDSYQENFEYDENIFRKKMIGWGLNEQIGKLIVLDNGLGDHYCFKHIINDVKNKYQNLTLAVCYPEVFEDDDVKLISISDAKILLGDIGPYGIYSWMEKRNWKKSLLDAYKECYL